METECTWGMAIVIEPEIGAGVTEVYSWLIERGDLDTALRAILIDLPASVREAVDELPIVAYDEFATDAEILAGWRRTHLPPITGGREVEGVYLEFKDGKCVKATAEKNEEYLLKQLDTDEGARYLGEFAIGTNYGIQKFTKSILFDEKIGGTMHLAIGGGFIEAGGENQSAIHWDMICDMRDGGQILVDDELFYENGQFKV